MIVIPYQVRLEQDVLLSSLQGDPNTAVSYGYIPGAVLRGALVAAYLHAQPAQAGQLAVAQPARDLFFSGQVRYLHAYPLAPGGQTTRPVPLSWYAEKGQGTGAGDCIVDAAMGATLPFEQPKLVHGPYVATDQGKVYLAKVQHNLRVHNQRDREAGRATCCLRQPSAPFQQVHNQRDREAGRATKLGGEIFRYEALARDQCFAGAIWVGDDQLTPELTKLVPQELWLGSSRSAEYGRVTLTLGEPKDQVVTLPDCPANQRLWLVLESDAIVRDAIVRDANGAWATTLRPELLGAGLAQALALKRSFTRQSLIGGYNRKWGLPLVQERAIAAGSVFCYCATQAISGATLAALVEAGLGLRTVEGYGRLRIELEPLRPCYCVAPEQKKANSNPLASPELAADSPSRQMAQTMVDRLYRQRLDLALAEWVNGGQAEISSRPRKSQLQRLRGVVLDAISTGDTARVATWLEEKNLRGKARGQFEQAKINGQSLLEWLNERVTQPETVWRLLRPGDTTLPTIGGVMATQDEALAKDYALRAIEACLHRASKEARDD